VFGGSHRPELAIGRVYRGSEAPSRRSRSAAEAVFLAERASLICCLGLQGEVALDGAELVARRIAAMEDDARLFIVDLHRVSHLEPSGARLLHETRTRLAASGRGLVFARAPASVRDALDHPGPNADRRYLSFDDDDLAMEWCENQLLAAMTESERCDAASPSRFSLFAGLHGHDLASVCALLEAIDFRAGDCVLEAGEEDDDRIFLVLTGQLSVLLPTAPGRHQRLSTLGAGACFGEMLLLGHRTRSATVFADSDVSCWVLSARRFEALAAGAPDIKVRVLENIARDMSVRLRNLNALISALAS